MFDIFSANADKMEKLKADQQALEKSVKWVMFIKVCA